MALYESRAKKKIRRRVERGLCPTCGRFVPTSKRIVGDMSQYCEKHRAYAEMSLRPYLLAEKKEEEQQEPTGKNPNQG